LKGAFIVANQGERDIQDSGNAAGDVQGTQSQQEARDISQFNKDVDASAAMVDLKGALKSARHELEKWKASSAEEKQAVLEEFDRFGSEATKATPNKSNLNTTWSRIKRAVAPVSHLESFVELGNQVMNLLQATGI
jgi:hypothetical protein